MKKVGLIIVLIMMILLQGCSRASKEKVAEEAAIYLKEKYGVDFQIDEVNYTNSPPFGALGAKSGQVYCHIKDQEESNRYKIILDWSADDKNGKATKKVTFNDTLSNHLHKNDLNNFVSTQFGEVFSDYTYSSYSYMYSLEGQYLKYNPYERIVDTLKEDKIKRVEVNAVVYVEGEVNEEDIKDKILILEKQMKDNTSENIEYGFSLYIVQDKLHYEDVEKQIDKFKEGDSLEIEGTIEVNAGMIFEYERFYDEVEVEIKDNIFEKLD